MNRRGFVGIVSATAAAAVAHAQKAAPLPTVGLLWIRGSSSPRFVESLHTGLRSLGWVDGKNLSIDDRFLVDGYDGLAAAAARLAAEKVAVILAYGTTAMSAAHKAAPGTPIVVAASSDPVTLGLASSWARPGGSVTGLTSIPEGLAGKKLELLKELVPAMRRLAVVLVPGGRASLRVYEELARAMKIDVQPVEIRDVVELEAAIAGIARMQVQAITVVNSTLLTANSERVVTAIAKLRIPAIYSGADFAEAGGLMSHGVDLAENFRLCAAYVDKILKGAKPGDLPIEQPTRLELVLNKKTANSLNLRLPQSVLVRIDRVVD